jgi:hypothetical protein
MKKRIPVQIPNWYLDFGSKATFFLILAGFGFIAFYRGGIDYRGYHAAAMLVLRGGNPYDYSQLAPILEEIAGFQSNNPYFYPPWYVLPFIPLTFLPFEFARAVWIALNLGMFYISLEWIRDAIDWDLAGWRRWLTYLAAFLLFGAFCLISEQAGILLLFGITLTLRSIKRDQPALAGLGLVITLTKPQATILAVILLGTWMLLRKPLSLIWAIGWTIAFTLMATVAIPDWWNFDTNEFGQGIIYQLEGPGQIEFRRVYSTAYDFINHSVSMPEQYSYLFAGLVGLIGVGLVAVAWLRVKDPVMIAGSAILLTLLITPYSLQYDYVPLIALLFWILMRSAPLGWPVRLLTTLLLAISFSVLIWQEWSYEGYWQVLGILAALVVVVVAESLAGGPKQNGTGVYK